LPPAHGRTAHFAGRRLRQRSEAVRHRIFRCHKGLFFFPLFLRNVAEAVVPLYGQATPGPGAAAVVSLVDDTSPACGGERSLAMRSARC